MAFSIETLRALQMVLKVLPSELHKLMKNLLVLAQLGEDSFNKVFGSSDA